MSLINKALRDLDARKGKLPSGQNLQPNLSGVQVPTHRQKSFLWLFLVLAFSAAAALWFWFERMNTGIAPLPPVPVVDTSRIESLPLEPAPAPAPPVTPPAPPPEPVEKPKPVAAPNPAPKPAPKPAAKPPATMAKTVSAEQRSAALYREAAQLIRAGNSGLAQERLGEALALQPANHDARQLLARVLIEERKWPQAKALLQQGIQIAPMQSGFYMSLAHAQLQGGETDAAIGSLSQGLPHALSDAPYLAMLATLLQQKGQHAQASKLFVDALRIGPNSSRWLVGLGVSLQAQGNSVAAAQAFSQALEQADLPPALETLARDRLNRLQPSLPR